MSLPLRHLLVLIGVLACLEAEPPRAAAQVVEPVRQEILALWDDTTPPAVPFDYVNLDAPKGGTLRLAATGVFDNFNPYAHRGRSAGQIGYTLETLGEQLPGNGFFMQGLLARDFELAPDRSWLRVRLRTEARFSDGMPVTSRDVVYSFQALVNEATPLYREYYAQVASATAEDDHTVLFTFAGTDNRELPLIVCQMVVLPAHWWEGRNLGEPQLEAMPGSGPYWVKDYALGAMVTLERNPHWWGASLPVNAGRYNFDTIRLDYYRDSAVAREAFFAGEVDFYLENTIKHWVNGYDAPPVRDGRIQRREMPLHRPAGMSGFFMNTRRGPLAQQEVRRALCLLFDFQWTNQALFHNLYRRCDSFFTASEFAAPALPSPEELAVLEPYRDRLDPAVFGPLPPLPVTDGSGTDRTQLRQALALLQKAGWTLQDGVLRNAEGHPMRLIFLLSSATLQRAVIPFQNTLARLGIHLDIQLADQTQYLSRVQDRDFDLIHATVRQSDNPGNEQRSYWTTGAASERGTRNYAGVADPVVDELVERLIASGSRAELITATRVLDRVLLHGSYVVPGWYTDKSRHSWWSTRITPPPGWPPDGLDITAWHRALAASLGRDE